LGELKVADFNVHLQPECMVLVQSYHGVVKCESKISEANSPGWSEAEPGVTNAVPWAVRYSILKEAGIIVSDGRMESWKKCKLSNGSGELSSNNGKLSNGYGELSSNTWKLGNGTVELSGNTGKLSNDSGELSSNSV